MKKETAAQICDFKFLVVDQTSFACKLVMETLFVTGARDLSAATNLKDAMEQIRSGRVNFLICEHDLETENGIDLVKAIRSDGDELIKKMPIVLLTTVTDRNSIFSGRDAGVDEIVAKPFTADSLRSHIEAVIHKRRAFIEDPTFSGPDRRRRLKEIDGEDRRGD